MKQIFYSNQLCYQVTLQDLTFNVALTNTNCYQQMHIYNIFDYIYRMLQM